MASVVDICNMALSHIGSDAIVTSVDPVDGSVEAGHCARFYPIARAELIEAHAWTFAKRRTALAAVANPSNVWAYAYTLPSNIMRPLRVLNSFTLQTAALPPAGLFVTQTELALFNERGSADFEIETAADGSAVLLTHEPDAVLLHTVDVTDTSRFTAGFVVALSHLLAAFLAGPLIKGSAGATTARTLREIANTAARAAMVFNANSSAEPALELPGSVKARR